MCANEKRLFRADVDFAKDFGDRSTDEEVVSLNTTITAVSSHSKDGVLYVRLYNKDTNDCIAELRVSKDAIGVDDAAFAIASHLNVRVY